FTATPVALAPHDHRIELSAVELLEQSMGEVDPYVEAQQRIEGVHTREQAREAGARDVVADSDCEPPIDGLHTGERVGVRGKQIARAREEACAGGGQPDGSGRSLD